MPEFSAYKRQEIVQQLSSTRFDVLVIGGGITGAGIALDAAARGLTVALIEMQDIAAGTSGRSTKLIHGGLRYLKQLELKLVAEVGKEREIIHRLAPQLTQPEPMLLPMIPKGAYGKFSTRIGMLVYEQLAGVKKTERHRMLNARETKQTEPLLQLTDVLGGVLFYEYRTDDARLTLEVMKEAVKRGTVAVNYVKAKHFLYENNKVTGVEAQEQFSGAAFKISARYVVNATGPWVDELDQLDAPAQGHKLNITKGVHLVVDHHKLPAKQALYIETKDKRMIFVIPREGKTYIGTTDTFYKDEKTEPVITAEDKQYLLSSVNASFPGAKLSLADIESGWAGLRPLINKPGKGPSEISRRDELFDWPSGLITIAGGKLTGYRKMAQRVVDTLAAKIKKEEGVVLPPCSTDQISLAAPATAFAEWLKSSIQHGQALGLSAQQAELLAHRYGVHVDAIYKRMSDGANYKGPLPLLWYAQLLYTMAEEACATPADFFIRRTAALYFDIHSVKQWKEAVITEMQTLLDWDEALTEQHRQNLERSINAVTQ